MSPKVGVEPVRQAQIIEATLRLIARHGSHNVSIQSVATEARLSKGAVLHYYPTKEDLFAAVFREFFSRIFERSKKTMAMHDDPLEKLRSFGDWLFDENDPDLNPGYPLYLECMARAVHEDMTHRLFCEWVNN
ncbi:MAG: TetR family transcriptional regulator [Candidatus Lindowbacteria bacterium]|nr:TetR family transcriptional regulator [Candidatus Lindowbacteria bacterium]